jgi:hypothetical protein
MRGHNKDGDREVFKRYFESGFRIGRDQSRHLEATSVKLAAPSRRIPESWNIQSLLFAFLTIVTAIVFWTFDESTSTLSWIITTAAATSAVLSLNSARFPA